MGIAEPSALAGTGFPEHGAADGFGDGDFLLIVVLVSAAEFCAAAWLLW